MLDDISLQPLLVVAAALLALALVAGGVRLLIWALRWAVRGLVAAASAVHPVGVGCALAATILLAPSMANWAFDLFLQTVRLLLFELPRTLLQTTSSIVGVCTQGSSPPPCGIVTLDALAKVWSSPLYQPVRRLTELPSDFDQAVLVFVIALIVAWAVRQQVERAISATTEARKAAASGLPGSANGEESPFYRGSVLALSLVAALCLCITAIIAIPVFNDRPSNLEQARKKLGDSLIPFVQQYKDEIATAVIDQKNIDLPAIEKLRENVRRIPTAPAFGLAFLVDTLEWQISVWKGSVGELQLAADNFGRRAEAFAGKVVSHFTVENTGRIGGTLTEQHAAVLASWYDIWLSDYVSRLERCRAKLGQGASDLGATFSQITNAISMLAAQNAGAQSTNDIATPPIGGPQFNQPEFTESCANLVPDEDRYLSRRQGPAETLGFFGKVAGWLLRTESRDLALITGLLGFGFFGALAASFIREFADTKGNALPPSDYIMPALVRGVAAAILVFLAVVGGLAIFAQSGPEPNPNPYAVFLACFIAAVFSEDVWAWARRFQQQRMGGRGETPNARGAGRNAGAGGAAAEVQPKKKP